MQYRAITRFADLQDGMRRYEAGDDFPRPGLAVSAARLAELAGSDNRAGYPLIEAVPGEDAPAAPKPARKRGKTNA